MVLAHFLRCQRFLWRGLRDRVIVSKMISGIVPIPPTDAATLVVPVRAIRAAAANEAAATGAAPLQQASRPLPPRFVWPWLRQLPFDRAFVRFIAQPIVVPVYCGLRMIDEFGHVNNSKYLEICELARWHQLSFLGLGAMMARRRVAFVVSDLSIIYQREIGPRSTVLVATQILLPPSRTACASEPSPSSVASSSSEKRRVYIEHQIWSSDGRKLHAALTLAAALIGPMEYEQELTRRYDPTAADAAAESTLSSAGKRTRQRTTLNCEHAIADAMGLESVAELHKLFNPAEHMCTPMADDDVTTAPATGKVGGALDQESAERQERVATLTRIWRTSRDRLRHKSLVPPSS
ncbi:hypothetical protein LSCM1_04207 [Leishmania martiniquensis]|uniref:Thioesterase-like protein n=1 Tax=Leishmania martiniquensis TaxID=1580590 RepID=A0A836KMZ8_9TRYP|nr:hypothetical protein LSCM1_04207 [Leishmania martiniquensis]